MYCVVNKITVFEKTLVTNFLIVHTNILTVNVKLVTYMPYRNSNEYCFSYESIVYRL